MGHSGQIDELFDNPGKLFYNFCSPVRISCTSAENFNEIPGKGDVYNTFHLSVLGALEEGGE